MGAARGEQWKEFVGTRVGLSCQTVSLDEHRDRVPRSGRYRRDRAERAGRRVGETWGDIGVDYGLL